MTSAISIHGYFMFLKWQREILKISHVFQKEVGPDFPNLYMFPVPKLQTLSGIAKCFLIKYSFLLGFGVPYFSRDISSEKNQANKFTVMLQKWVYMKKPQLNILFNVYSRHQVAAENSLL